MTLPDLSPKPLPVECSTLFFCLPADAEDLPPGTYKKVESQEAKVWNPESLRGAELACQTPVIVTRTRNKPLLC